jgi:competence protein ComGC
MYECALVTMILVFMIIVIVHVIIPFYYKWKLKRITDKSNSVKAAESKEKEYHENLKINGYIKKINFNFNRIKLCDYYGTT